MPTRKIKKSYRSVTGVLASKKNARMVASESTLERDLYHLLEFDPMVESYEEQPATLSYQLPTGQQSHYTPDVVIHLAETPKMIWRFSPFRAFFTENGIYTSSDSKNFLLKPKHSRFKPKTILAEVKYREDLFELWKELKPKFKAARRYAEDKNWQFNIFTEIEIRTQLLSNIKFIRPFGRYNFSVKEIMKVLNKLAEFKECKTAELLAALTIENRADYGTLIPIIWHLVFRHEIIVDWNQPLTLHSTLSSLT